MKDDKKPIALNAQISELSEKEVEIKTASLKDALCNYSYELLMGKTAGDVITRKGNHIIHEDLENAFKSFNVFLAHLDDAFTGNDNTTELEFLREEPETEKYNVSGFKITGVEENKAIILIGSKNVDNGVISFTAPKIKLNGSYLYLAPLHQSLDNAIYQVEEYMNGKTAPQPEQVSMEFQDDMDDSFEQAKVAADF